MLNVSPRCFKWAEQDAYLAGVGPQATLGGEPFPADVAVERSVLQPLDLRDKTAVTLLYQPAYVHSSNKQCTAESEPESYIKFQIFVYSYFFKY